MPPARTTGRKRRPAPRPARSNLGIGRRVVVAAIASVAVVAVVGAAVGLTRGHRTSSLPRTGSDLVRTKGDTSIPAGPPPLTFHATYAVDDRRSEANTVVHSVEEDWVRRPFEGRRELRKGIPPGGAVTQVTVWALGRFEVRNTGAEPQTLQTAPGAPGNDLRPDAVRKDAIDATYFTPREERRVDGRMCQVYRTAQGAVAGPLEPTQRREDTYSDLCFDRQGILLEEVGYTGHDVVIHRRVAVALEVDGTIGDDRFAFTGTTNLELTKGGGSLRALEPTSRPPGDSFLELDGPPPAGFNLQGRYAVVPPQPEAFSDPTKYETRQAGVVDVYTRGADFLLIDRGGTVGGGAPFATSQAAAPVDLGSLGPGEAILGMTGTQVRALLEGGHYIRISGTLPQADLVALTKRLTPQPAGELHFLDAG